MDIVDTALAAGTFTVLAEALTTASLVETLKGTGPFTVFAPTDNAFAAALTNLGITKDQLLAKTDLSAILTYHVVGGTVKSTKMTNGMMWTTLQGATVTISIAGSTVKVNTATVTTADIMCTNGVIHVIDQVLLPPAAPAPATATSTSTGEPEIVEEEAEEEEEEEIDEEVQGMMDNTVHYTTLSNATRRVEEAAASGVSGKACDVLKCSAYCMEYAACGQGTCKELVSCMKSRVQAACVHLSQKVGGCDVNCNGAATMTPNLVLAALPLSLIMLSL